MYKEQKLWSGNQNINVTVSNTGEEDICGWAVSYAPGGEIYNIWDAKVVTCEEEKNNTGGAEKIILPEEATVFR